MTGVARLAVIAGAITSAALTAYVGWHGARVLIAPFLAWVVSPFVLLWWVLTRARSTAPAASKVLSTAAVVVSAASVAAYTARVVSPPGSQGAFVFVIVPPIAWFVVAGAGLMAWRSARPRQ
jgi:hypothetical protein